jgi:hypothetical protein
MKVYDLTDSEGRVFALEITSAPVGRWRSWRTRGYRWFAAAGACLALYVAFYHWRT